MNRISNKPKRWDEDNSCYFLTFCTYKKRQILHKNKVPEILVNDIQYYEKYLKELIAYTIMPDHVHMLIEVNDIRDLSIFLQRLKSHSSKMIKAECKNYIDYVWQYGTMDHWIRNEDDFLNHLNYIFYNSKKHLGLSPKDFKLHNFKDIVERGWIEEDFCDFPADNEKKFEIYE